ncbi:MAG TPA: hypothetical protein VMS45_01360, partial [Gemmatimonadaceae bacterium]|nr:hypothetical protein [Gemmatimonadaceae bacterium]
MLAAKTMALAAALGLGAVLATFIPGALAQAGDADGLLTIDHYVPVRSTVPSISGQTTEIYVRERARRS